LFSLLSPFDGYRCILLVLKSHVNNNERFFWIFGFFSNIGPGVTPASLDPGGIFLAGLDFYFPFQARNGIFNPGD
jgi:hypothetical protein